MVHGAAVGVILAWVGDGVAGVLASVGAGAQAGGGRGPGDGVPSGSGRRITTAPGDRGGMAITDTPTAIRTDANSGLKPAVTKKAYRCGEPQQSCFEIR